jgi:hypothetical protein
VAHKITVSVPDRLYSQIEKWKSSLSFSKIFQEAIKEKIKTKEAFEKRLKGEFNMGQAVARLSQEKAETEWNFFNQGKEDGFEWAKFSDYSEIKAAIEWDPGSQHLPENETLRELIFTIIQENPELGFEVDMDLTADTYKWAGGWVEGVKEFWSEVKNHPNFKERS